MTRKRILLIAAFLCAFLGTGGLVFMFEPFAPRYEGRTVYQWLVYYEKDGPFNPQLPSEMIDYFGDTAKPRLYRTVFHAKRLWELQRTWPTCAKLLRPILKAHEDHAKNRSAIACQWNAELTRRQFKAKMRLKFAGLNQQSETNAAGRK